MLLCSFLVGSGICFYVGWWGGGLFIVEDFWFGICLDGGVVGVDVFLV